MDLTTRIFTDLAKVAKWAFNATMAKPGTYTLTEMLRDKTCAFLILTEKLDFSTLPECAERVNENEDILRLSYNDGKNVYQFRARDVFGMLNKFKRIADEVKASDKASCCTFTREEDEGELIAIYDMPKTKTKAMAKAAANDDIRPVMYGVTNEQIQFLAIGLVIGLRARYKKPKAEIYKEKNGERKLYSTYQ